MKLPDDGFPEFTDERTILLLRNVTEHWEDPTGWSTVASRKIVPDAAPGQLIYTKKDVWIEGVSTAGIVARAIDVDRALRARRQTCGLPRSSSS